MSAGKLAAALAWSARGMRVFPLQVDSKDPLDIGWTVHATTDEATIRGWWTDPVTGFERDLNVGFLTTGWVVLDVDVKNGKPGLDTMMELGLDFGETLTTRTPSGGYHLVYRNPGFEVGQSPLGPGIDVRGFNGYVVAVGSTIGGLPYTVEIEAPVAEFPAALVGMLKRPRKRTEVHAVSVELDAPEMVEVARHWLQRDAPVAVEGVNGDDTTYRVACRARDFGVSETTAVDLLLEAYNPRCAPPWSPDEIRAKVENAYRYATGEPGARSPAAEFGDVVLVGPPAEPASNGGPPLVLHEDGAAQRFTERHAGRLRFDHDAGTWFEWCGSHWRRNGTGLAFHWARQLARELARDEDEKTQIASGRAAFAGAVERFARTDPAFAVMSDRWDCDLFLLGTPDGTVDLRTGVLRPAVPQDGITRVAATSPARTADCPIWRGFLSDATGGDAAMIRFLQQWAGYSLTGATREHALVFLFGDGGNGKSVFVNTLAGLMGDYAVTASMDTFSASRGDRHPADLAALRGARLVTASETEEGRAWAESRIKQMTGGDPITARFMRQDFFTYQPQFKLTIIGNHRPTLSSVDAANRRRFNLVPFTRTPARPDRDLENKLKSEWPGILRWALDGCLDWQRSGLVRPASVVAATDDYFAGQDTFGAWLSDECETEPGNTNKSAIAADLFAAWSRYCLKGAEQPGSRQRFADQMKRRGLQPDKGAHGVRLYRGVALRGFNTPAMN